jgi:hypothetical protein
MNNEEIQPEEEGDFEATTLTKIIDLVLNNTVGVETDIIELMTKEVAEDDSLKSTLRSDTLKRYVNVAPSPSNYHAALVHEIRMYSLERVFHYSEQYLQMLSAVSKGIKDNELSEYEIKMLCSLTLKGAKRLFIPCLVEEIKRKVL